MSKSSGLPISEIVARVATSGKPKIRFEGIDDDGDGGEGREGDLAVHLEKDVVFDDEQ